MDTQTRSWVVMIPWYWGRHYFLALWKMHESSCDHGIKLSALVNIGNCFIFMNYRLEGETLQESCPWKCRHERGELHALHKRQLIGLNGNVTHTHTHKRAHVRKKSNSFSHSKFSQTNIFDSKRVMEIIFNAAEFIGCQSRNSEMLLQVCKCCDVHHNND